MTIADLSLNHDPPGASPPGRARWKKTLYGGEQPGYPDNYTDASFLEAMVVNAHVVERDLGTVVRDAVAVSHHFSVVATVAVVWTHALTGGLDASSLLTIDACILALHLLVLLTTTRKALDVPSVLENLKNFGLFVGVVYVLNPVFQTLTRSISSDSIWASTVCLLLLHLYFHDYGSGVCPPKEEGEGALPAELSRTEPLASNVSVNASIAASVLIASRVAEQGLVFALMLFSLESFLLVPLVARRIVQRSVGLFLVSSVVWIVVTCGLLYRVNRLASVLFVLVVLLVDFVCPYWLIRIQKYKFEINGPWDEAKLCFTLD